MNIRLDNIGPSNLFNSVSKKTGKFKSTLVNLYERAKESRAASQGSPVIKGEKNPKMPGLKKVTQCFQHLFKTKKPSDKGVQEVEKTPFKRAKEVLNFLDENRATPFEKEFDGLRIKRQVEEQLVAVFARQPQ